MNVVFHALVGGAIAHGAVAVSPVKAAKPLGIAATIVVALASHGVLDWLRHGYPIPSRLDVVAALALAVAWPLVVQPRYRVLLACALAAAFAPDILDHLPRLVSNALGNPTTAGTPLFPWHTPRWSGSTYPQARLAAGSVWPALEAGHNRARSWLNHALVTLGVGVGVYLGRRAFLNASSVGAHLKP
jgi:hypothetical protein